MMSEQSTLSLPAASANAAVSDRVASLGPAIRNLGGYLVRYSVVVIIVWIGLMKFTEFEARAIEPLVRHSPLMAWVYQVFHVQTFSTLLGIVELVVAALLAVRPWAPRLSALGAFLATGMFATTLSFLVTTPGVWEESLGGFPAVNLISSFLLKDLTLLAAAVWMLGDSLSAIRRAS